MQRLHLLAAFFFPSTILCAQGDAGDRQDSRIERLARALQVTMTDARDAGPVPAEALAKIGTVTDAGPADAAALGEARVCRARCESTRPRVEGEMFFCQLPRAVGEGSVVAAVDDRDTVHAAVLDEAGATRPEFARFCAQLLNRPAPHVAVARSVADLAELRAALARSSDDESGLTRALLTQHEQMMGLLDPLMATLQAFSGQGGEDRAGECIAGFEEYAKLDAALDELLGEKRSRYRETALEVAAQIRDLQRAVAAGESARPIIRSLQATCNECHGMQTPLAPQGLRRRAAELRLARGFGSDYYVLGHDLRPLGVPAANAQQAATEIRRALLLIDAVKTR